MEPEAQIRNLRDFLMVYNRMTEMCFQRCTSNFNYRSLTMDEERCADSCAGKLIRSNHRLMGTYVNLMPGMVQRRMAEMEKKNAELVTAEAAGALEGTPDLADQGLPIASTPGKASAPAPGTVEALTASEVSKPAVLDFSADVGPAASPATPSFPEPLVPSSLSQAVNGAGITRLTSGPVQELSPVRHDQSTATASAAPSGPHHSR